MLRISFNNNNNNMSKKRERAPETDPFSMKRKRVSVLKGLDVEVWRLIFTFLPKWYSFLIRMTCRCWRDTYDGLPSPTREQGHISYFRTSAWAASGGHLKIMKWLLKIGCYDDDGYVCCQAAGGGHLDALKWARKHGYKWDKYTCSLAAGGGHLAVLKWARENGCDWHAGTCAMAAREGHLDVLKWARENGCDWSSHTCLYAAEQGHLEVLKWASENGCRCCEFQCIEAAVNGAHADIVKWYQCDSKSVGGSLH